MLQELSQQSDKQLLSVLYNTVDAEWYCFGHAHWTVYNSMASAVPIEIYHTELEWKVVA